MAETKLDWYRVPCPAELEDAADAIEATYRRIINRPPRRGASAASLLCTADRLRRVADWLRDLSREARHG